MLETIKARSARISDDERSCENAAAADSAGDCLAKAIQARAVGTPAKRQEATIWEGEAASKRKARDNGIKAIQKNARRR